MYTMNVSKYLYNNLKCNLLSFNNIINMTIYMYYVRDNIVFDMYHMNTCCGFLRIEKSILKDRHD
jgi:hypothetical protein